MNQNTFNNLQPLSEVRGILNDNATALNAVSPYLVTVGFFDYNDATTATTPISVTAATETKLTNDAAGAFTNTTYPPLNISSIWDTSLNCFDFSQLKLGDMVDIRLDIEVETLSNNTEVEVDLYVGVGQNEYPIPFFTNQTFKTAGVQKLNRFNSIYMGDLNTLNGKGEFRVTADANVNVKVNGWYVRVLQRGFAVPQVAGSYIIAAGDATAVAGYNVISSASPIGSNGVQGADIALLDTNGDDLGAKLNLVSTGPASEIIENTAGKTTGVTNFDGTLLCDPITTSSIVTNINVDLLWWLKGLKPSTTYNISVVGSRDSPDGPRQTTLTGFDNGDTISFDARDVPVIHTAQLTTNSNGGAVFTQSGDDANTTYPWSYVGGISITEA